MACNWLWDCKALYTLIMCWFFVFWRNWMKMVVYLSRTASVFVTDPEWITSGQKPNRGGVPINARLGMVSVLQWPGSQIKQSEVIQVNRRTPSTCLMYIILMQSISNWWWKTWLANGKMGTSDIQELLLLADYWQPTQSTRWSLHGWYILATRP